MIQMEWVDCFHKILLLVLTTDLVHRISIDNKLNNIYKYFQIDNIHKSVCCISSYFKYPVLNNKYV